MENDNLLKPLLFPVGLVGLHTEEFINENNTSTTIPVKEYFAVINLRSSEVFSVVSRGYSLLLNEEAIAIGKSVFVKLFPLVSKDDLIPFNVVASKRLTFCFIDLVHKDVNFDLWEQETWLPFLRVTNSYNKTYAFTLEIGFVKKLTWSGIILDKKTVEVKQAHSGGKDPWKITANISTLQEAQAEFINYMLNLKRFLVPSKYILPLILKALNLKYDFHRFLGNPNSNTIPLKDRKQINEYQSLKNSANGIFQMHSSSYGESAFAAFNTIIDITNGKGIGIIFSDYASKSRRLNENLSHWIKDFTDAIDKRSFDFEKYLAEEINYVKRIDKLM
jgi:hypothetical protein